MLKKISIKKFATRLVATLAFVLAAFARIPSILTQAGRNTPLEFRFVVVTVVPSVTSYLIALRDGHAFAPGPFAAVGTVWQVLNALAGTNANCVMAVIVALAFMPRLRDTVWETLRDHYQELLVLDGLCNLITGHVREMLHEASTFLTEKADVWHSLGSQMNETTHFIVWLAANAVLWYFAMRLFFPERFGTVPQQPDGA